MVALCTTGFIDEGEYNSPVCKFSFDSPPPPFLEVVKKIGKEITSSTKSDRSGEALGAAAAVDSGAFEADVAVAVIELEAFTDWWMGNHSDLGQILTSAAIFCIVLTVVVGFYAEVRIWGVIALRKDDGGIRELNKRIQDQLNDIQTEFTRHMQDIYDSAKKTVSDV